MSCPKSLSTLSRANPFKNSLVQGFRSLFPFSSDALHGNAFMNSLDYDPTHDSVCWQDQVLRIHGPRLHRSGRLSFEPPSRRDLLRL